MVPKSSSCRAGLYNPIYYNCTKPSLSCYDTGTVCKVTHHSSGGCPCHARALALLAPSVVPIASLVSRVLAPCVQVGSRGFRVGHFRPQSPVFDDLYKVATCSLTWRILEHACQSRPNGGGDRSHTPSSSSRRSLPTAQSKHQVEGRAALQFVFSCRLVVSPVVDQMVSRDRSRRTS